MAQWAAEEPAHVLAGWRAILGAALPAALVKGKQGCTRIQYQVTVPHQR